jgi:hypothetical protein
LPLYQFSFIASSIFLKNPEIAIHSACCAGTRQAATPTFFAFAAENSGSPRTPCAAIAAYGRGGVFTLSPVFRQIPAIFLPPSLFFNALVCGGTHLDCRAPLRTARYYIVHRAEKVNRRAFFL